ncbi:MAG: diacylglycerol kinase [Verrucomicrobia bacterium]|nr:diacylglycerol kinase [Verrucomicrobiota bacterium]MDA1067725.1 diacylglycerol kinase [Verrucomicrobiota bacterium]
MEDSSKFRNTGIKRIILAGKYSMDGLWFAFRNEAAFRQEALLSMVLIPLAIWLQPGFTPFCLLVGSIMLVMIVELLNTGIETAIDYQSMDIHPLAKLAKDLGSAAVFLSLLNLAIVWGFYLWDRFA